MVQIVGFGDRPAPIGDDEIENLRRILSQGAAVEPHRYLGVGQTVRIARGLLADLEGVLVRKKGQLRLLISIELIRQSATIEVDAADVEPVARVAPTAGRQPLQRRRLPQGEFESRPHSRQAGPTSNLDPRRLLLSQHKVEREARARSCRGLCRRGDQAVILTPSDCVTQTAEIATDDGITVVRVKNRRIKGANKMQRAIREARLSANLWRGAKHFLQQNRCELIVFYSPTIFFGKLVGRLRSSGVAQHI